MSANRRLKFPLFILLMAAAISSAPAIEPLRQFKIDYSLSNGGATHSIYLVNTDSYHAEQVFHDLLPGASKYSTTEIK
jgi:hypothetical protein